MPSGYYGGYGSKHHAHWVWHTKANNCITLSDAPQLIRSPASKGYVIHPYEDDEIASFCGDADASYRQRASRCRRHVVYLKRVGCFFLVDVFVAQSDVTSSLQWNIHSWNPFEVDSDEKGFRLVRGDSQCQGRFLFSHESFISLGEGWDPRPQYGREQKDEKQQANADSYHAV